MLKEFVLTIELFQICLLRTVVKHLQSLLVDTITQAMVVIILSPETGLANYCAVPKSEAGLLWDGICFGFLLMQRRLFSSFYFQHLVTEMKAQTELASRQSREHRRYEVKQACKRYVTATSIVKRIRERMKIVNNQKKIET